MLLLHTLTMRRNDVASLPSGFGGDSVTDRWTGAWTDGRKNNIALAQSYHEGK